jgi:hypothetical protein
VQGQNFNFCRASTNGQPCSSIRDCGITCRCVAFVCEAA